MISALLACAACSDSGDDFADSVAPENKVNPGQMVIRLGRTLSRSYDLAANTRLFQFHADSVSLGNGAFVEEPALTPLGDDRLTFNLGEGVWNFSLVSSREPLEEGTIQEPEYGKRAQDCPMFSMISEGGTLQSAPEIYTALVDNFRFSGKWQVTDPDHNIDEFVPDRDYTVDAQMLRNMAKIVVHFKSSEDLDPAKQQLFTITNVPTTLDWRGGLYPDKNNPEISAQPLRGAFDVHYETTPEANKTVSDQVFEYIIPAHRGLDYSASAPVDTTTSLLRLNVDFTCLDETHVTKNNIVLGYAPRVNGVYDIYVSYNKRKLNVEAQILPWAEERADADVSNAEIVTDKSRVEFAHRDTIRIESRRPVTVTKAGDAPWLTVEKISDNIYALEADINSYYDDNAYNNVGHQRSSNIILRDGNLERIIPVLQRPDVGTIEVHETGTLSNREMWVSPVTADESSDGRDHNKRSVDVTSIGGPWKILKNLRVYNDVTGPAGKSTREIRRFNDEDIDFSDYKKAFGRERVIFMNTETLDTASIWVDNLFIGLTDDIVEIDQPTASEYKVVTTDQVVVYGGEEDVEILNLPKFISATNTYYNKSQKLFYFNSKRHPEGDDQWGKIKLGHKTDPDYKVELYIDQAILVTIPEFDFFVVNITWETGKDIDIYVGLDGNPSTFFYRDFNYNTSKNSLLNGKYLGWCYNSSTKSHSIPNYLTGVSAPILTWGGDNTNQNAGENVYLNAPLVNGYPYPGQKGIPQTSTDYMTRVINMNVRAGWYSQKGPGNIIVSVVAYKGGKMQLSGTMFNNVTDSSRPADERDGKKVYESRCRFNNISNSYYCNSSNKTANLKRFADIKYDRKKHTAKIEWGAGGVVELEKVY